MRLDPNTMEACLRSAVVSHLPPGVAFYMSKNDMGWDVALRYDQHAWHAIYSDEMLWRMRDFNVIAEEILEAAQGLVQGVYTVGPVGVQPKDLNPAMQAVLTMREEPILMLEQVMEAGGEMVKIVNPELYKRVKAYIAKATR